MRQENNDAAIDLMTGLTFAGRFGLTAFSGSPGGIVAEVEERHPELERRIKGVEEALSEFEASCGPILQSDELSPVLWERGGLISVSRRRDVTESFVGLERVCEDIRVGAYDNDHSSSYDADDIFSRTNDDMEDAKEEQAGVRATGRAFAISSEVRDAAAEALALLR